MRLDIREATPADATAIGQLLMEGGELHAQALPRLLRLPNASTTQEFIQRALQDHATYIFLAELSGEIVGFVHFNWVRIVEHPVKVDRSFIAISSLLVQEAYRRQGIGHALMQKVHDWATSHYIDDIELQVYEFNQPAISFYENLGYHTTSRRMMRSTRE